MGRALEDIGLPMRKVVVANAIILGRTGSGNANLDAASQLKDGTIMQQIQITYVNGQMKHPYFHPHVIIV